MVEWLGGDFESATDHLREASWPRRSAYLLVAVAPAVFEERFPRHFFIGLVLGVLRVRTGSLYPGMLVRLVWNAAVVFEEYRS